LFEGKGTTEFVLCGGRWGWGDEGAEPLVHA
jgi:hypothetical protein